MIAVILHSKWNPIVLISSFQMFIYCIILVSS